MSRRMMIVRIPGKLGVRISAALTAAQIATFLAGAGLLAWSYYVIVDSAYAQWAGSRALVADLAKPRETVIPNSASNPARSSALARGSVLGNFAMPRLGLSFVILEGTDSRTLDKSIGRVEYSGLLGENGNIGIAGHRNTHFRKLEGVRRDDEVVLTSHNVEYRYRVEWIHVFKPDALEVLDPGHGPALTLITCFPFEYVGSAPLRFVVRALPDDATRAKLTAASTPASATK